MRKYKKKGIATYDPIDGLQQFWAKHRLGAVEYADQWLKIASDGLNGERMDHGKGIDDLWDFSLRMAVVVSHNTNPIEGLMSLLKHNGYKQLDHYRQEFKLLLITSVLRPIREVLRYPSNRNQDATNYEKMKDKPLTKSVCNGKQYTLYA